MEQKATTVKPKVGSVPAKATTKASIVINVLTSSIISPNAWVNINREKQVLEVIVLSLFLACDCNPTGSLSDKCNQETGNCSCKNNYRGRTCDICEHGYYDYPSCLCKFF